MKYNKSDRVKLSEYGLTQLTTPSLTKNTLGTVVGVGRYEPIIRVKWDSLKSVQSLHKMHLTKGEENET